METETIRTGSSVRISPAFGIRAAVGLQLMMMMLAPTLMPLVGTVPSVLARALELRQLSIRLHL